MFRKGLMALAIGGMLTMGVGFAREHVYVNVAPPAAVVETPPPTPGPDFVWTPGYYRWDGNNYVWTSGQWVMPPHHHAHYVAGHWVHHHHQWYFEEGHWR